MTDARKVGFDRKVALGWLDATAAQVAAGADEAQLKEYLWRLLEGSASGKTSDGARRKTITVLKGIWLSVPDHITPMRDRALDTLPHLDATERMAVHWAMSMASYPYFASVAGTLGKLFALQGNCTAPQVARRMRASWGDRELIGRTTRHVVRTMVDWGALVDGAKQGRYVPRAVKIPLTSPVQMLLAEAVLQVEAGHAMELRELNRSPALFPFSMGITAPDLRSAPQFRLYRHALDQEMVTLAPSGT